MTPSPEQSVIIQGVGAYTPARVLTNEDLSRMVDTSDEWIRTRTGIRERRIAAPDEATSDMATKAAAEAIADAGIDPSEIELIIVGTVTPDMPFPNTACFVQQKLGLGKIPAFDVEAACSGFLYTLDVARALMLTNGYRHALVIGAENLSSIPNWEDRTTCVLSGDGAGAAGEEGRARGGGEAGGNPGGDAEEARGGGRRTKRGRGENKRGGRSRQGGKKPTESGRAREAGQTRGRAAE